MYAVAMEIQWITITRLRNNDICNVYGFSTDLINLLITYVMIQFIMKSQTLSFMWFNDSLEST